MQTDQWGCVLRPVTPYIIHSSCHGLAQHSKRDLKKVGGADYALADSDLDH